MKGSLVDFEPFNINIQENYKPAVYHVPSLVSENVKTVLHLVSSLGAVRVGVALYHRGQWYLD